MSKNQVRNQHLMWRAGFGPAADQLPQLETIHPGQLFQALQKASQRKAPFIDVADDALKGLVMGIREAGERNRPLDQEERKMVREKNRDSIKSLNLTWMYHMVETEAQLREKTALFWHGHFAARNLNIFFQQQMLQVIRENALGNFRDLLFGVSKSAAMLNFLNAQQNRKGHPNENFAREVMELFTLGRGNYTEQDIKEAARAFTGWSSNNRGEFIFRPFQHDGGEKKVLNVKGKLTGDDVLEILLQQKQTARFITGKIYRYFVNDIIDDEKTGWLAERFYASDYNISKLLEDIFTSEWFYDKKNIGSRIKSPVELLVGIHRILPMKIENEESLLILQRLLGQVLFYPPNVAGWPGGKNWIDSSTLMVRMRLPHLISEADRLAMTPKTDDDVSGGKMEGVGKGARAIRASIDWQQFIKQFEKTPREQLLFRISQSLLQTGMQVPEKMMMNSIDSSSRDAFIRSASLQVMSLPEYQMC